MKKIISYFETKDGSIVRLNDIKYINYPCRFIEMNGGRTIIFSKDESDDFKKCVEIFKEMRDIFDEYDTLKVGKEMAIMSTFKSEEYRKFKEGMNETDK